MWPTRKEMQRSLFRPLDPVTGQPIELATRPAPIRDEPALWSRLFDVPNRLYGTTINIEGDAI